MDEDNIVQSETDMSQQIQNFENQPMHRKINLVNKLNYTKTFKDKHTIDANLFLEYNKYGLWSFYFQEYAKD